MSKQRIVKDEIWSDDWFYELDRDKKLIWLFLLTNERGNVAGIYKLNIKWASNHLAMKEEDLTTELDIFQDMKKVIRWGDWILLINFHKHQSRSPKIKAGISRILKDLPSEIQEKMLDDTRVSIGYRTLLNSTLLNSTLPNGEGNPFDEPSSKFSNKDLEMAELLTSLIKRNYPDWQLRGNMETWAGHIEKLHRIDGRTYQQIEYMIRWTQSHSFWRQNILSTSKLRDKFNELIPKLREDVMKRQRQDENNHDPIV